MTSDPPDEVWLKQPLSLAAGGAPGTLDQFHYGPHSSNRWLGAPPPSLDAPSTARLRIGSRLRSALASARQASLRPALAQADSYFSSLLVDGQVPVQFPLVYLRDVVVPLRPFCLHEVFDDVRRKRLLNHLVLFEGIHCFPKIPG